ncbi:energy-coupling factor transporter transmembrane protein EcfT [Shinella curvata]|uniref:Energy-coupling factor transporter transmembrane protein EcfT n=1 Tax=Shinella curvata TaxID=1817964 RepID=A0ABT8XFT2_9HYPH|nr:energy-coupling factor transporter transmembrane protein EcfT [Shinella curvata]MCJ8053146.1 energy-coupling factor transporter transmembrane protein EcfT [Shinella curvata]MDO6122477.1 energy-coupling factor transporter transmembrane protein EcfT [Shinella curvata]
MLNGLDIEGNSPLHRMPVRGKLIVLFAAAILLFLLSDLRLLVPALGLSVALYLSTGIGVAEAARRTRFVLFTVLLVAAANTVFQSPHEGAVVFCRLSTLVLLAAAVTATTGISAFMDEITRLITPLERFGFVRAADVSLAVGLVIRFVPEIFARYGEISAAHKARGLPVRPLTTLVPLIILTLKDADTIAMAIDARGFRRQ